MYTLNLVLIEKSIISLPNRYLASKLCKKCYIDGGSIFRFDQ